VPPESVVVVVFFRRSDGLVQARRQRDDLAEEKRSVPAGMWTKCPGCRAQLVTDDVAKNDGVCPQCEHHFPSRPPSARADPRTRAASRRHDASIESVDPLGFRDSKKYRRSTARRGATRAAHDAVRVGSGTIDGRKVEVGRFVFEFMGGSMGSVVGEKVTRLVRARAGAPGAGDRVFGVGRRAHAGGRLSLMQMAEDVGGARRLREAGLPYISVLLTRRQAAWPPASPCWATSSSPSPRR
jgi:acetyl-CoA carboxylase carboxyl transferase subunit beta